MIEDMKQYMKTYNKEYYVKNRQRILPYCNQWQRNDVKKRRDYIFEHLGNKCNRCEETDYRVLQLDHLVPCGCDKRKRFLGFTNRYHMFRYLCANPNEIKRNFQILCANCNWIKRHENREAIHEQR